MTIAYLDTSRDEVRSENEETIEAIHDAGLIYPVTIVEGHAISEGAVSYPAVMRAVENVLVERARA